MMEKLFGKQGQDLVYGTRPTREAFYLLSEKIRRDSFPVQGPWFSISDNDKADLMTQKLIDHFETWAEENFKLRTLKSIRKIVIDLIKDGKKIAKRIKSAESKFLATRHEYFIFYDLITPSSPTAEVPQRPVEVSTDTSIETIPASPSYSPSQEEVDSFYSDQKEDSKTRSVILDLTRYIFIFYFFKCFIRILSY